MAASIESVGESKAKVNSTKGQVVTHSESWPYRQLSGFVRLRACQTRKTKEEATWG